MDFRYGVLNAMAISWILCAISSSLDTSATNFREDREEYTLLSRSLEMRWLYEEWLVAHDISYGGPREKERRFDVFKENLRFIDEHNRRPENNHSYVLGLNRFADLTNEEFTTLYLTTYTGGNTSAVQPVSDRYVYRDGDILPNCVDWRSKGAVGPVKDQGRCKSCWAFSAVAAIEGINYITIGQLITLSEQQILDCEMWNVGCCKTGYTHNAYEFVMMNGGIDTDQNYPYHKKKEKCKWNSESAVSIAQYEFIPRNSENSLQKAVANQPISVVVASHCIAFQFYKSGIFDGACGEKMRHSMVVVGYGIEDGKDYWIVKNSWGEEWGEAGYMRMERNIGEPAGKCGITTYASYPIMCPMNS